MIVNRISTCNSLDKAGSQASYYFESGIKLDDLRYISVGDKVQNNQKAGILETGYELWQLYVQSTIRQAEVLGP